MGKAFKNRQTDRSNQLFLKVQEGDPKALEILFYRIFPRLYDFASKITKNETIAEDILQDVFIQVWEKRQTIKSINIEGYLFRLVRNQCFDYIKSVKMVSEHELDLTTTSRYEELYRIDFVRDEPYLLIEEELKAKIENTMDLLPPRCKEVFILSKLDGLKNREIADKLQISIKNVEKHLSKAMKIFKDQFAEDLPLVLFLFAFRDLF